MPEAPDASGAAERSPGVGVDGAASLDSADAAAMLNGWTRVVRGVEAVQHAFALRLEAVGMSLPYFAVLRLLSESPDQRLPMSRIARDLAMTSGGFTKLADRMARDRLIDRRGSAGDRRVVFAALTEAGHVRAAEAAQVYEQFVRNDLVGALTSEGLGAMSTLAARLDSFRVVEPAAEFAIEERALEQPDRRHEG